MPQYSLDIGIEAVLSKLKTGANISHFTVLRNAVNNISFPYSVTRNKLRSSSWGRKESLKASIGALKQELIVLKREKAKLENLLKTQEESTTLPVEEIQFEIDLNKLVHQVAEITQTKYFQQLRAEVEYLQNTDC
ncbi:hypothetical protein NIES4071_01660 [Calothrix sp. NIES-4071]|nr:hypothetical protein NIES4071_01660 [Calothrix sp. NIES-4071]BAZ54512.1 hypothetical protein NIES4105_01650 [Calothrix sp. NIES-4105]